MSKSILSLSGNRAINYLLKTTIDKSFDFLSVDNVFQALHELQRNPHINFLIVDVDFQNEFWDLIGHIKTSKLYNIPVIVLASENNDDVKDKCFDFGVDEFFFKPFNPLDLIASLENANSAPDYKRLSINSNP